ncbi:hypothetical protein BU25DRAFT_176385 [Macroventuria anomochaeta]|uniref:Uncharacterized protein n=1 Tax=Macroventuria anomochaeta TaxID=301207 RepID=A0ACB6RNS2_9PLEO|nr:uncharacterized protein BU25DRAFT_176385 [Macroventuria anomochaeta]KAF2623536.1 hypothetical protein BU25DRAFT_176385 [Macroventuria anomochaeta]
MRLRLLLRTNVSFLLASLVSSLEVMYFRDLQIEVQLPRYDLPLPRSLISSPLRQPSHDHPGLGDFMYGEQVACVDVTCIHTDVSREDVQILWRVSSVVVTEAKRCVMGIVSLMMTRWIVIRANLMRGTERSLTLSTHERKLCETGDGVPLA